MLPPFYPFCKLHITKCAPKTKKLPKNLVIMKINHNFVTELKNKPQLEPQKQ